MRMVPGVSGLERVRALRRAGYRCEGAGCERLTATVLRVGLRLVALCGGCRGEAEHDKA